MRWTCLSTAVQVAAVTALAALLGGCGLGSRTGPASASVAGQALHGSVYGGLQPVGNSTIHLLAPGTGGYGSPAVSLLHQAAATDAYGNFNITGDYTCPDPSTPVLMVVSGGNPGLAAGTNNPALALMSVLGPCGNLGPDTFLIINELTTIAAVYSLQPFMSDALDIGAPASNLAGLSSAVTTAGRIASLVGNLVGSAPANAVVPRVEIGTLGDIVSSCVNTNGSTAAGSPCARLFAAATPAGGSAPTDTITALLDIARNPGHNTSTLYNLATGNGPYQPTLSNAPPDWTIGISYSAAAFRTPADLAVDSSGQVWVIASPGTLGNGSSTLSSLTTAGVGSIYPQTLTNFGNLAIDGSDNLWLSDTNHSNIVELTQSGGRVGSVPYSGGGITGPGPMAFDPAGNLWVANNSATVSKLNASGAAVSPASGYATAGSSGPVALAVDSAGQVWTTDGAGSTMSKLSNAGVLGSGSPFTGAGLSSPSGVAINSSNEALVANRGSSSVTRFASSGSPPASGSYAGGGLGGPLAIAVDGSGASWVANGNSNSVSVISSSGVAQSGSTGYGAAFLSNPYRLALDGAGNVWVANLGSKIAGQGTITQLVGAGAPVVTPLAAAVAQGKVATRP